MHVQYVHMIFKKYTMLSNIKARPTCYTIVRPIGYVGPVPARYVRQSQICPQLDMSDKNDKKTHDMSDKARCVRQKFNKIA